ncbi:MAG: DNA ligase [Rhodoferax sp.]|nr:DNA ligase [Rhodoferax sp.]
MNAFLLYRRSVLRLLLSATPLWCLPGWAGRPALMLANVYRPGIPLADYWVSEKYDGVRGYWDGSRLFTRGGAAVAAPAWFTAGWPAIPMDGELWAGHGAFGTALSTVRQQRPVDMAWRGMRFMVFDLPAQSGTYDARLPVLRQLLAEQDPARLVAVAQTRTDNHGALQSWLDQIVQGGGEGLMLHRGAAMYKGERNGDLLKFKPYLDADAKVVGWVPGKGKYDGQFGALMVETPQGRRFKLGTGFSDAQRREAPAPGTWVTYRFRDNNASGIPRFASFLRIRDALEF